MNIIELDHILIHLNLIVQVSRLEADTVELSPLLANKLSASASAKCGSRTYPMEVRFCWAILNHVCRHCTCPVQAHRRRTLSRTSLPYYLKHVSMQQRLVPFRVNPSRFYREQRRSRRGPSVKLQVREPIEFVHYPSSCVDDQLP